MHGQPAVCVCVPGFLVGRHKVGLKCCHSGMAAVPARHDSGLSPLQQRQKCLPGRSVREAKRPRCWGDIQSLIIETDIGTGICSDVWDGKKRIFSGTGWCSGFEWQCNKAPNTAVSAAGWFLSCFWSQYLTPHVGWTSQKKTKSQGGPEPANPRGRNLLSIMLSDLLKGFSLEMGLFYLHTSRGAWASSRDVSINSVWALIFCTES